MGDQLALTLALEGRVQTARAETRRLVALAGTLAALPEPEIDEGFAAALEARLLTEGLETQPVGRPQLTVVRTIPETPAEELVRRAPIVQMPRRRHVVRRSVVAIAAAASLAAFPVAASASSLPGSPFYGLKLRVERMQLAMFGDPTADGFMKVRFAQTRAAEVQQLVALGAPADLISETLALGEKLLSEGSALVLENTQDPAKLSRLAELARQTEAQLRSVMPATSGATAAHLRDLLAVSQQVQDAVANRLDGDTAHAAGSISGTDSSIAAPDASSGTTASAPADPGTGSGGKGGTAKAPTAPPGTVAGDPISDGPDKGCEIPLREELGDTLAPVARLVCE